jgi:fatty acid desaturase
MAVNARKRIAAADVARSEHTMEREQLLKAKIRAELPGEIFERKPMWSLLVIPLVVLIIAGSVMIVSVPLPWYVVLLCSLVVGHLYASLTFLGHDVAHGASVRPGLWHELIVYLSFGIYGVSPHLWREWHHKAHHGQTNVEGRDPDNFGTLEEFRKSTPFNRFVLKAMPGSGHWLSASYLFLFFTIQAQGVLWLRSKTMPDFSRMRRRRAVLDAIMWACIWAAVCILTGWKGTVFVVLIPMMVSNFIVMSYIVTTHMLCPMVQSRDTLRTSMSVTTNKVFDILHFHFSHHVEHHIFPTMCSRYYPLVRQSLRRHFADHYIAPPHWRALLALFRTPRLYEGADTLADPFSGRRVHIPTVLASLGKTTPWLRDAAVVQIANAGEAEDCAQAAGD